MDAVRSQRVGRHRRAERRINAARNAENDAGKIVFLDIIAKAKNTGGVIGLGRSSGIRAGPSTQRQALGPRCKTILATVSSKAGSRPCKRAIGVER